MSKIILEEKVIWITGASSGIGKALALTLAKKNNALILSGRNKDALESVKDECLVYTNQNIMIKPFDVKEEASIIKNIETVKSEWGRIDIIINNAGVSQRAPALETTYETEKSIMQVNFFAPVLHSKLTIKELFDHQSLGIINICSLAGKLSIPMRSSYTASKHAMQAYFNALRFELKPSNIHVLTVYPGYIKTNLSNNALTADGTCHGKLDSNQKKGIKVEVAARKILLAFATRKHEYTFGGIKEMIALRIQQLSPLLFRRLISSMKLNQKS